jgi:(E)-4-hydroxy-3-methylbut-2-enyl-diphosphate synthase
MRSGTHRRPTRRILVGSVPIGGGSPIAVQSMTNTDTKDVGATLAQIKELAAAGCRIVRLAVPDMDAALAFGRIRDACDIPLIADIHFDHRLAIAALERGADAVRINPGTMASQRAVEKVAREAIRRGKPIRVGVNSGSLPKDIVERFGGPCAEALVEGAVRQVELLESMGLEQMKVSIKSSHVLTTIRAYEMLSDRLDYPLHLGVTEAGTLISGTVKSSIGIGYLLYRGIGDTIRVSLTRPPVEEVKVAYEILRALDIEHRGPEVVSCPTCGRCEIDLFSLVEEVERALSGITTPLKIAVMGCVVNGPGEAREADVGIAGGRSQGILFKGGRVLKKVPEKELAKALLQEVNDMICGKDKSQGGTRSQ